MSNVGPDDLELLVYWRETRGGAGALGRLQWGKVQKINEGLPWASLFIVLVPV